MSRATAKIALAFAAIGFGWVLLGNPLPANQWLGDAPILVQALAVSVAWFVSGVMVAPWIGYVWRQVRARANAFRSASR